MQKSQISIVKNEILRKHGFSLVEVLFSLMILSVGISSVAVLMTSNIKNSITTKNQVIASSLAQEGIELIRNIKDNNDTSSSLDKLVDATPIISSKTYCTIDYDDDGASWDVGVASNCGGSGDNSTNFYTLYYNNGFYVRNIIPGANTKFTRRLEIIPQKEDGTAATTLAQTYNIRLVSIVTWDGNYRDTTNCTIGNKCVYIDTKLTK